ncbi:MAG: FAD-linked oxidase C-terminal domain-containing protein [Thermodesulfovibrionales bacterium]
MKKLGEILPSEQFSAEPETLICYGFDASGMESSPSAVVWPESTDDIVKISKFAYKNEVPICPRGAGTGMTGGATPLKGSMVISFERMNRILEIDAENMTALVEPGVINGRFQQELDAHGLFYPPDPASMNFCTLGGNVAENAGGPRAVKYGVTRDYVLEIEGVLPDGRIIHTGVQTAKGVVGYDLTSLLTGSEGTLCTMSRIRLKLLPQPQGVVTLIAFFDDIYHCGTAVTKVVSSRIIPRTMELMDSGTIRAIENYKQIGLPEGTEALLLIELDGNPKAISDEAKKVSEICRSFNADVQIAETTADKEKLWEARRSISPALFHICPGKISEDVVVPRSKIPDLLKGLKGLSKSSGINIVNFGHAGDGNMHVNIMADRKDTGQMKEVHKLIKEIFTLTIDLGGTISGEHGVGITKSEFIGMEIKQPAMDMMMGIKKLFDHKNILNPGKIFP